MWHKITDELPTEEGQYLILDSANNVWFVYFSFEKDGENFIEHSGSVFYDFDEDINAYPIEDVCYWAEIPALPHDKTNIAASSREIAE